MDHYTVGCNWEIDVFLGCFSSFSSIGYQYLDEHIKNIDTAFGFSTNTVTWQAWMELLKGRLHVRTDTIETAKRWPNHVVKDQATSNLSILNLTSVEIKHLFLFLFLCAPLQSYIFATHPVWKIITKDAIWTKYFVTHTTTTTTTSRVLDYCTLTSVH